MKKVFEEHFNNKAILKGLWDSRMIVLGLALGFVSTELITKNIMSPLHVGILATTLLFLIAYVDFKLSNVN